MITEVHSLKQEELRKIQKFSDLIYIRELEEMHNLFHFAQHMIDESEDKHIKNHFIEAVERQKC